MGVFEPSGRGHLRRAAQIALIGLIGMLLGLHQVAWAQESEVAPVADKSPSSIPADLHQHLEKLGIELDNVSLVVRPVDSAEALVNVHSAVPRNPASVMKMLTTYAALSQLGPGYQWETEIRRTGLADNGVLRGDLVIVGRGNPMFVQQDLWEMVNQLETRGITSVAGDLVIDGSYFDVPDHDPAAFDGKAFRPYNAGPDATLFNFSSLDFSLVPKKGDKFVDVRVAPEVRGLEINSSIQQLNGECRSHRIKLRLDVEPVESGRRINYSGHYPQRCGRYQLTRAVLPSNELLYGTLSTLMAARGGEISGGLLIGKSPRNAKKLFTLSSKTLSEVVRSTNKFSNNVMSRQLLLTLGAEVYGEPATPGKGVKALKRVLQEQGVPVDNLTVANGSGLCRQCLVTADTLMALLDSAWASVYMPEFIASLGVPGIDGSLRKRFPKGSYKGRVHMKTGTIDHVSAAAGYVQTKRNERYQFALIINQNDVHKGKGNAFQRRLMSWLVNR